jgi:hypothetical protein
MPRAQTLVQQVGNTMDYNYVLQNVQVDTLDIHSLDIINVLQHAQMPLETRILETVHYHVLSQNMLIHQIDFALTLVA